ncbi:energy transducer TonB [Rufibacter hautae]|uniref:Energy transducer TonB n=1 Tax=Rufibacter hautae TaxID=2595005 RepID=A0A5B6TGC2_9BACT|nr:energy transducer TonB [Rufibacter hautae]KAA3438302.1 energy transducer TonB [Rufibacter hautae]
MQGRIASCFRPAFYKKILKPTAILLIILSLFLSSKCSLGQNRPPDYSTIQKAKGEVTDTLICIFPIEQQPEYKHGGLPSMLTFIQRNLRYKECAEGTVVVQFVIDSTGQVREPILLKSLTKETDAEAMRVVQLLEFTPGMHNGRKMPIRYVIPIRFGPVKETRRNKGHVNRKGQL